MSRETLGEVLAECLGTTGIFATYPQPYLTTFPGGFIDQVVGTAIGDKNLLQIGGSLGGFGLVCQGQT
ncbi:MAG: hypothetical protein MUC41_16770 [Syntrophobacteraceae bacterium]|jgi:hypothetical protein|nr:hypothetical protein [Syntrophobacteraceae bacterium]